MKITKSQLKQIIMEELSDTLGHKASRKLSRVGIAHESEDVRKEIMDMILALDTGDEQDTETLASMAAYLKDASAANVRQGLGLEEKEDHPGETCKQAHPGESHEEWGEKKMKITKSQLKQIVKEEAQFFRYEQIMSEEKRRIDVLHAEMQQEVLNEDWAKELPHIGLDVLGLIPGWGEAADLTNAALYAKRGEHLMAALSVISMIPVVGDIVGKGGKLSIYLGKFGAKGGAKAGSYLGKVLSKHMPQITKNLGALKSNKLIGSYVDDMAKAVTKYVDDAATQATDKLLPQIQKAVSVAPTKTVSKNKYVALAQKAKAKTTGRQHRQAAAQNLSGQEAPPPQRRVMGRVTAE